jgi:hypothetical protein
LGVLRALGDRAGEGDRRPLSSAFPAKPTETAKTEAQPLSRTRVDVTGRAAAAWLTGTMFLALRVLYFIGLDQGATSIFGADTHIREFLHDAPAPAGPPLPLVDRQPVQDAADLGDGVAMGGLLVVGPRDDHRGFADRAEQEMSKRPGLALGDPARSNRT